MTPRAGSLASASSSEGGRDVALCRTPFVMLRHMRCSTLSDGQCLSRRELLLAVLASTSLGCDAGVAPASSSAPALPLRASGVTGSAPSLEAITSGRMRDDERGGTLVILLHGWGARGDDLLSLAQALARPRTRFVLPAAPLLEASGGRAWWHLDEQRPARASDGELPKGHAPSRQLQIVREAVQGLIANLRQRHAPEAIALVGFSQGAMLALDVALAGAPAVQRVAALSGALLVDSLPALQADRPPRPAAFIAHGTGDPVVPFRSGEVARDLLSSHGLSVAFHAFDGGHTIPRAVTEALGRFLFEA